MKAAVLLNPGAGALAGMENEEARNLVLRGFTDAGADADVHFVTGREIEWRARDAAESDVDAIIAGGGDGTINTIANAIADRHKSFGVLPLGTHNHLAKDLGVPLDLDEAIAALARGRVVDLPVAEVNGRIFLNFSAIGLHPEVVLDREAQREESGRGKWQAMVVAMARKLRELPRYRITLSARGHTVARSTPSVIICNNPHQMRVFGVENASVPERGLLNVYVTANPRRRTLVWHALRAAAGKLDNHTSHFEVMALPELRIDSRRRHLAVSVDGEVLHLRPPLRYRIRPHPLRVLVPAVATATAERKEGES